MREGAVSFESLYSYQLFRVVPQQISFYGVMVKQSYFFLEMLLMKLLPDLIDNTMTTCLNFSIFHKNEGIYLFRTFSSVL